MTIQNTYAAESWNAVYQAFQQINFTSFDFDTVKESLLQYLQIYYAEDYNDFIESSELVSLLELFAYTAELVSYRADVAAHENFISTAQRKQSVLRLAKLISYSASRNIPARGLVKIGSVQTDQTIYDSLGNNLANQIILWNDPNNTNWQEQFFLVMNAALTVPFGQPSKQFQIADVLMQLYTFNNVTNTLNNGVFSFSATTPTATLDMECVPIDIDQNGPFERSPDSNAQFNVVYASDGRGNGSDYTGFLMFVKQGTLLLTNYTITQPTANRRIQLSAINVNNTDVWVYQIDNNLDITQVWQAVDSLEDQTLAFNNASSRYLYQIETLENDQIALLFGDGNFSTVPVGQFQLWTRTSVNQDIQVPQTSIVNQAMPLIYTDITGLNHNFNMSFSLTSALQNNSASETVEHVRQAAPSTYYAQDRMVNGQDYNTFMLQDSTILKLNTINRTFAGQPKYIQWNDASGMYQNIKLFGDDLTMTLNVTEDLVVTNSSSRGLIDSYIQPLLQTDAVFNTMVHLFATVTDSVGIVSYPRRLFIEDNRQIYFDINGNPVATYGYNLGASTPLAPATGSLLEKTMIQGALDQHWYGEPLSTVIINGQQAGVVPDPVLDPETDDKLYLSSLPRTIDGVNLYPPGDVGSGLQTIQPQKYFGLRFNRFLQTLGNGTIALYNPNDSTTNQQWGYGDGTFNAQIGNTGTFNGAIPQPAPANGLSNYAYETETITVEMQSDQNTFTVISNIRGQLADYVLSVAASSPTLERWSAQAGSELVPTDFIIQPGTTAFAAGDAFVIDIANTALISDGDGIALTQAVVPGTPLVLTATPYTITPPAQVAITSAGNLSGGALLTYGSLVGGVSYTNGAYTNVPLTGGSGVGAMANITVSGNVVTVVTITAMGQNYDVGDVLSALTSNLGGTGAGFSITVVTVSNGLFTVAGLDTSFNPLTVTISGPDAGYVFTPETFKQVNSITPNGVTVLSAAIANSGSGYVAGDVLTISGGIFTAAAQIVVNTISNTGQILTFTLNSVGMYTVEPVNPVSATGGHGSLATFNLTWNQVSVGPLELAFGAVVRQFSSTLAVQPHTANLNGWWELIPSSVVITPITNVPPGLGLFSGGASDGPNFVQQAIFDQSSTGSDWIFLVARTDDPITQTVLNWSIYNRDMKIIVSSPTTNFWYNQNSQIIDSETLLPLYDKIRILRSNLNAFGEPLAQADIYDSVNFAYDQNGNVITNSLEVLPTETINFLTAGTGSPSNMLQFENFAAGSYQFTLINVTDPTNPVSLGLLACNDFIFTSGYDLSPYDYNDYDSGFLVLTGGAFEGLSFAFVSGNYVSNIETLGGTSYQLIRQLFVPAPAVTNPVTDVYGCNETTGLDFMWQHFTPDANLIDPSLSNIHDAYILTQGYYTALNQWLNGITTVEPSPPTPLDLQTSYGYLLQYKMLSDTVVFHPGTIQLLFGSQADQTLQANFMVVVAPTATFTNQRIQQEVINTVNTYFQIQNWNFGQTFYATELLGLIHQALPTQISSVVLVPTYSVNSFGSLFTIEAGIDQVLQSCATVANVQIVSALTPSVLRQS